MRALLLAALATLSLSSSLQARSTTLPDFMLGGWCREGQVDLPGDEFPSLSTLSRTECPDQIKITSDGVLFNREDFCSFTRVERRTIRTWLVHASCKVAGSSKRVAATMVFEGWEGNTMMSLWEK